MKTRRIVSASALVLGLIMLSNIAIALAGDPMPDGAAAPICPTLYSFANGAFQYEGRLAMNETDSTITWLMHYNPDNAQGRYVYRLVERIGKSYIDLLRLNVTYANGLNIVLPPIYVESYDPFAWPKILFSDDWRFEMQSAKYLGYDQMATVYFPALPFNISVTRIVVEGHSMY